jgi:hypothetical protein
MWRTVLVGLGALGVAGCSGTEPVTTDRMDTSVQTATQRVPKSLVVALDGARADALRFASTPHFDSLADGSWAEGYGGAATSAALTVPDGDTVSGPNHVAIMTGGLVAQTGVSSNDPTEMAAGRYADVPHYLSLLESANADLGTAYLFTWATDSFVACEADVVALDVEEANVDRILSMLDGTSTDPDWGEEQQPDALFVFFDFIDGTGHSEGFSLHVDAYVDALERGDALVGDLLEGIRARPSFDAEDWQIVVTSDHGGYETGHGGRGGHRETIPFLISAIDMDSGVLPDGTRNLDVTPTVLSHFGVEVPAGLTGASRGQGATPPAAVDLSTGLVAYYDFDADLSDRMGGHDGMDGAGATIETTDGKFGGHLSLSGHPSYVSLPEVDDLSFSADQAFTVALWMRADAVLDGDPVVIGNKDWASGLNPGWAILANEGGDNAAGSNYGTGSDRLDVEMMDYAPLAWMFVAAVYRPGGVSVTYLGHEDSRLEWVGQMTALSGSLSSGYPIRIGQDGTAAYPFDFSGDVDEVAIWRRALSHADVLALHAEGSGVRVLDDR